MFKILIKKTYKLKQIFIFYVTIKIINLSFLGVI